MTTNRSPRFGEPLTDREVAVLTGMSYGKSNPTIGREMYLSEDTVKTHARRLFAKLGSRDRAHAVRLGMQAGFLSDDEGADRHIPACYAAQACPCRKAVAT